MISTSDLGPDYLTNLMYTHMFGYPCVELIGSEGPVGCSTKSNGEYGWMYQISTQEEFDLLKHKQLSGPIVIVVSSNIFLKKNIENLNNIEIDIKGIIVYKEDIPLDGFSPADKNPNQKYGLYPNSTYVWNPNGDSWMYDVQQFPIFAINNETFQFLQPYIEYNMEASTYPKYAIQLNDHMYARKENDVETCLRRHDCTPLGGKNVWSLLSPLDEREIVLSISSMDSNAFFHDIAPGADMISGTIALLGAIEALSHVNQSSFVKQPMFLILNGESFGYIGSKSFVNDLQNFTCEIESGSYCHYPFRGDLHFTNLSLSQFSTIIELNQIGLLDDQFSIFPHTDSLNAPNSQHTIDALIRASRDTGVNVSIPNGGELPGSSLMSFLSANRSQSGIVITEYNSEFRNQYYQSSYDNTSLINMEGVCKVSTTLARTVYLLSSSSENEVPSNLTANCDIIKKLYSCFTARYDCKLVHQLYPNLTYSGTLPPVSNYVGMYENTPHTFLTEFTRDWIANATASNHTSYNCTKTSECKKIISGSECLAGYCVLGTYSYYHDALSPAFEYQYGVGYVIVDNSPNWPQWTASYTDNLYLTLFWMDWPWLGLLIFIFGTIEFIVCMLLVYLFTLFMEKHMKKD